LHYDGQYSPLHCGEFGPACLSLVSSGIRRLWLANAGAGAPSKRTTTAKPARHVARRLYLMQARQMLRDGIKHWKCCHRSAFVCHILWPSHNPPA